MVEQPELFDLTQQDSPGAYLVLDAEEYHDGVVRLLTEGGLCSDFDGNVVRVKNTNDFSESYDIQLSNGFIRRGDTSYRETCNPANFPVNPEDAVSEVLVFFFSLRCPDDRELPGFNQGKLPMGCMGTVTATPKDANLEDVPAEIHGPDIDWSLEQDGAFVRVDDVENVPFNKNLAGLDLGEFTLCATVQDVQGCMKGEVIP